ncbi:MAG TPA: alpha/beta hydrolase [Terracidiphilus sp.]|nr:alpha/beta hydrolase [Terracidiphilus sp.]
MIRSILLALFFLSTVSTSNAQSSAWQPSVGHTQIPIWPGAAPDQQPVKGPETAKLETRDQVAGRPWTYVENVTTPTMTVYAPKGGNTGVAVVVFPGGGYQILAIDLEGTEVCDWLTQKGITCVLLKYRVTDAGAYPKSGPYPESPMALEDAQRTIRLVRAHASEWHIDSHKIGVMGFSAGGHLSVAASIYFDKKLYSPLDTADQLSCRPDFAVALYPGHLSRAAAEDDAGFGKTPYALPPPDALSQVDKNLGLNPAIEIPKDMPPTFLLQAEDDHVDTVYDSLSYYIALKKAGVPAEMHLYTEGNHGFGLRRTKLPITGWPQLVETWLGTIGMIAEQAPAITHPN